MSQKMNRWELRLLIALSLLCILGVQLLERFYFPVPRGTAGWDLYVFIAWENIYLLGLYHLMWKIWNKMDESAKSGMKMNLYMMLGFMFTGPASLIRFWNLVRIPQELIAYLLAWALIVSYFVIFHWRVASQKEG